MPSDTVADQGSHRGEEWIAVAVIRTTHGRHGEVAADLLTDFPERFQPGLTLRAEAEGGRRELRLEGVWFHKERAILKFAGVDTLTEAEKLRGALLRVPRSERHPLPPGRLYVSDLMGCEVLEQGEKLGVVTGWQETGATPLLQVESAGRELLIPFTPEICYAVDTAARLIRVRLPEGLRELNVATAPEPPPSRQQK